MRGDLVFFFVAAIGSYIAHGARRDTTNQFERPDATLRVAMIALVVGEVGAFAVLLAASSRRSCCSRSVVRLDVRQEVEHRRV